MGKSYKKTHGISMKKNMKESNVLIKQNSIYKITINIMSF